MLSSAVEHAHGLLQRANTIELSLHSVSSSLPSSPVEVVGIAQVGIEQLPAVTASRSTRRDAAALEQANELGPLFRGARPAQPGRLDPQDGAGGGLAGTAARWGAMRGNRVVGYSALAMTNVERASCRRVWEDGTRSDPVLHVARLALDRREQGGTRIGPRH